VRGAGEHTEAEQRKRGDRSEDFPDETVFTTSDRRGNTTLPVESTCGHKYSCREEDGDERNKPHVKERPTLGVSMDSKDHRRQCRTLGPTLWER
jgi:hypothetical protein